MIINNNINGYSYCPYISTEETIFKLLIRDKDLISDEYELMPYPLAHWINTIGLSETNKIISNLKSDRIRIFVCQHIYVDKLIFSKSDIVFTPHSSVSDNFISIPHYAVSVNSSLISESKDLLFSFVGSITTHNVRKTLVSLYDNCLDSKLHWGLESKNPDVKNNYISMLGNSKFSLCPRGTGISSVRLFESMAMESIPVIIADNYQPPLSDIIDWNSISIFVKENEINNISNIVHNKLDSYCKMKKDMVNIYQKYFSNENLHKTIKMILDSK